MSRVTADDIRNIMPETTLEDGVIEVYAASAHIYIDSFLLGKYEEEMLKEIERWMTAHMIAMTQERTSKEEGAGGAYIKYAGDWSTGLLGTSYGQMVYSLDTEGWIPCIDCDGGKGGSRRPKDAWSKAIPGV